MKAYAPPYGITTTILNLVAEITESLGRIESDSIPLQLRKINNARSIHSSLAIENNTLSLEQVSRIIEGKTVPALKREIDEVKNAAACYELISTLNPHDESDLLRAHSIMMNGLVKTAGKYRTKGVGIFKGDKIVHMAPPAEKVPALMSRLLFWLKDADIHPIVASSVFHYEFEFIHPFADGNGRMGRFWQTLILSKWNGTFSYLPVENVIRENQEEYYATLSQCDAKASATVFVEFMVKAILKALKSLPLPTLTSSDKTSANIGKLLRAMSDTPMSAAQIMKKLKLSHKTNFRKNYLSPAIEAGLIKQTLPDSPNSPLQQYYLA